MRKVKKLWELWALVRRCDATEIAYITEVGSNMKTRFLTMGPLQKGNFADWIATECEEYECDLEEADLRRMDEENAVWHDRYSED